MIKIKLFLIKKESTPSSRIRIINTIPLLQERGDERILLVVVTADKGLCGGFNTNLFRLARNIYEEAVNHHASRLSAAGLDSPTEEESPPPPLSVIN